MSKYTAEQVEEQAERCEYVFGDSVPGGMLLDYAALLRERESAKAAVTDEIVRIASDARYVAITGDSPAPPNRCEESDAAMRAALEAVAPMLASAQQPIPMVLHCPSCHVQHIDRPETHRLDLALDQAGMDSSYSASWNNPPHRSHLCHTCGTIWRPADVPTVGVEKIQTEGKNDVVMPAPLASARVPDSSAIVRDVCECDRPNFDGENVVVIELDDLRRIIERHVSFVPVLASARVPDESLYTRAEVAEAMELLRKYRSSIPSECLDEMENRLLAAAPKLENVWPAKAREKAFSLAQEMLQKGSEKPEANNP